jgi:hypothetical protein
MATKGVQTEKLAQMPVDKHIIEPRGVLHRELPASPGLEISVCYVLDRSEYLMKLFYCKNCRVHGYLPYGHNHVCSVKPAKKAKKAKKPSDRKAKKAGKSKLTGRQGSAGVQPESQ